MTISSSYILFLITLLSTFIFCQKTLKFNKDGKFKIVQFADSHYGYPGWEVNDNATVIAQYRILSIERPDLVALTGDVMSAGTGKNIPGWFKERWTYAMLPMTKLNIPWAFTFGNHDAEGELSAKEIVKFDSTFENSLTQMGPDDIDGTTNYVLSIQSSNSPNTNVNLFFMDSGVKNCYGVPGWGCVTNSQVEWFRKISKKITIPALLFMHIPLVEVMDLWNERKCFGNKSEPVCCQALNTGLFSTILESKNVKAAFFGHDHYNDYYGDYYGVILGYGRKSGYGSYTPKKGKKIGARVIEIQESPNFSIKTWIRQEDGTLDDQQHVHMPNEKEVQGVCCGKQIEK